MNIAQLLAEAENNQWSIGVCAQIINADKQVLLIQRAADDWCAGVWEMPGGGKEQGESLLDCIHREVQEETGLTIIGEPKFIGYFDFSHSESAATKRKFCFRISATVGTVQLSDDHSNYGYFSLAKLNSLKVETTDGTPYEIFRDHYQLLIKNLIANSSSNGI